MKRKPAWDAILGMLLFLLAAGFLAVSVFLCFSDDIWYDELFTMGLAGQSFGELISVTARDVHPPLYYIIVKLFLMLFQVLGANSGAASASGTYAASGLFTPVAVAKLVSVLPFSLCLLYGAVKVRKHFGLLAAGLFAFLVLAMPQLGGYMVEVRMYGYALFFVTAGMLHAYELTLDADKKSRIVNWMALSLYSLAACYTHYFACVGAVMIYACLLFALLKGRRFKEEWKAFLASGFFCALGYLPWIFGAVRLQVGQVKENYWIQPVTWRTLGGCVKFLFQPAFTSEKLNVILAVILFVIYAGLFGGALTGGRKRSENYFVSCCVAVLAGIAVFGFAASLLIRPIFVYRYMLPAMGLFWLAFAILLSQWKKKKAVFFPIFLLFLLVGLKDYRAFYGEEMWKRVQMADVREALSQIDKEDAVVFNFDQTQGVVSFYLPNEAYLWYGEPETLIVEMYPQNHALVEGEFSDEAGIDALKVLIREHERVWFCGSGNARDEIIEKWGNFGIEAEEKASLMVERYWFNLYQLKNTK